MSRLQHGTSNGRMPGNSPGGSPIEQQSQFEGVAMAGRDGVSGLPQSRIQATSPRAIYRNSRVVRGTSVVQRAASPVQVRHVMYPFSHQQGPIAAPVQVASPLCGSLAAPVGGGARNGAVSPLRGFMSIATQAPVPGVGVTPAAANSSPLRMRPQDSSTVPIYMISGAFQQTASPLASPMRLRPQESMPATAFQRAASPVAMRLVPTGMLFQGQQGTTTQPGLHQDQKPLVVRRALGTGAFQYRTTTDAGSRWLLSDAALAARSASGTTVAPADVMSEASLTDAPGTSVFSHRSDRTMVIEVAN